VGRPTSPVMRRHGFLPAVAPPAAVIQEGTLPGQRVLLAPLAEIAVRAAEKEIRSPALVVVGDVVRFAGLREDTSSLDALNAPGGSARER